MGWAIGERAARRGHGADPRDGRQRRAPGALPAGRATSTTSPIARAWWCGPRSRWSTSITDAAAFTDNARQQLTELIRQNYNHPSIVFWGIGNEQRADNTRDQRPADRAEHARAPGGPDAAVDLRAVLHQRHGRAARPHRRRRLQHLLRLVRRVRHRRAVRRLGRRPARGAGRPGRSASASTAPAPASRSTPPARRSPIPTARRTPRSGRTCVHETHWKQMKTRPLPVGEVHLEHVRLRRRQPQRGRHARAQRQGPRHLRSQDAARTRSTGTRRTGRRRRSSTSRRAASRRAPTATDHGEGLLEHGVPSACSVNGTTIADVDGRRSHLRVDQRRARHRREHDHRDGHHRHDDRHRHRHLDAAVGSRRPTSGETGPRLRLAGAFAGIASCSARS